jgi:two-component system OmpR family response regulator
MPTPSDVQIAIVEDDPLMSAALEDMLTEEGYKVFRCPTGATLTALMKHKHLDLILLDLQLPDASGLAIAAQVRAVSKVAIIMLTAKGSEIDRIVGLEVGADDYLVKPFSVREVLARVRAMLRRTLPVERDLLPLSIVPKRGYRFDGWTLDSDMRQLIDPRGKMIALTVGEFDLLSVLVQAERRILSRTQLLDMTRKENGDVFERTIDVLILRLRRKIEVNPTKPSLVITERGCGYIFNAKVERFGFE